jgi:hypothetical protein
VFCCDSMSRRRVDPSYQGEHDAALAAGVEVALISYEALVDERDAEKAVRTIAGREHPAAAVYRGWMLTPERYGALHGALAGRGVQLINDPAAYRRCHWLPGFYPSIEAHTARSAWISKDELSVDRVLAVLRELPAPAAVIKDYVKSRKHEWEEACFIPDVQDAERAGRVVRRFLELQGDDLQGGVVVREFVSLASAGPHPKSGMPMAVELRAFVLDGKIIVNAPYWDDATYQTPGPPSDWLAERVASIDSRFFTIDVAQKADGTWIIIEVGDAQVSQLPDRGSPETLYQPLAALRA